MFTAQDVLEVHHWTPELFSFSLTRPDGFKFHSGQFVMLNLPERDGFQPRPRAYSITSPDYAETSRGATCFCSARAPGWPRG